jgi:Cupin
MFLDSEKIGQKTYKLSAGGGGSQTLMSSCSVNFDELTIHPLLELMPPVLLLQGSTAGDTMLPTLLHAMADKVMEQRVGAATVLARLADVVITRIGCDSGPKDWQRLGCYPPSSG